MENNDDDNNNKLSGSDEYESGSETDTDSVTSTSSLKENGENLEAIVSPTSNTCKQSVHNNNLLPLTKITSKKGFSNIYNKISLKSLNKKWKYETVRTLEERIEIRNKICICLANSKYEAIRRVSKQLGYKIVKEHELWNICWTDSIVGVELCKDMRRFQKINHFPGMFEICRKDLLARNLNRMLKLFPLDYQIFPKTWCFPADLGEAIAFSKCNRNKTFILKPDQGSQGKGIWLTKNLKEIKPTDRMICQLYISRPLLIDGFKFDLRVYTLITSTDPLRIFVYNEGLARFATTKYSEPCGLNTSNMFMHLTNYSVNKHSRTYSYDDKSGSKRKFTVINKLLEAEGHDTNELWANIDDIIVKTILSAYPMLKHNYSACFPCHDLIQACFEILGIDILIDNKLKPHILEVNHSPSFHTDESIDREIKDAVLRDTFAMLHISACDKKRVLEEDKERVKARLLQKIKDHTHDGKCSKLIDSESSENTTSTTTSGQRVKQNPLETWAAQISWEESHLGGFRRILPPKIGDPNKYAPFFIHQNQASVYSDTAASKRREECAKQLRKDLADKLKIQQAIAARKKLRAIAEEGDEKSRRKKKTILDMEENDENEWKHSMVQRDFLVRSCGLLQNIIVAFFRNNLLTPSDRVKYKDMLAKIYSDVEKPNNNIYPTFNSYKNLQQKKLTRNGISNLGIHCVEAPISYLPPLPSEGSLSSNYWSTKTTLARQITNSVKMHNYEIRENWNERY